MKHSPSLRSLLPTTILSFGILVALGGVPSAAFAQSSAAAASDAATTWNELRAAAQQKLQSAELTGFLKKREMPWTHVFDAGASPDARVAAKYGVNAIPFMVLIGRDGTIAGVNLRGPALAKAVTEALGKPPAAGKRSDES